MMISVIVPVYNDSSNLSLCLESVFRCSYKDFEVIVVDDNSSQDVKSVCKRFPVKYVRNKERRGSGDSRIEGTKYAQGQIIAFLDSDCEVPGEWLSDIRKHLGKDIGGIGGRYIQKSNRGTIFDFTRHMYTYFLAEKGFSFEESQTGTTFLRGGNCAFWKRALSSFVKKTRRFDGMAAGEDSLLCLEISKRYVLKQDNRLYVYHNKEHKLSGFIRDQFRNGWSRLVVKLYSTKRDGLGSGFLDTKKVFSLMVFPSLSVFLLLSGTLLSRIEVLFAGAVILASFELHFMASLNGMRKEGEAVTSRRRFLASSFILSILASVLLSLGIMRGVLMYASDILSRASIITQVLLSVVLPGSFTYLVFFVTSKCNSRCRHCFYWNRLNSSTKELSTREIEKITVSLGRLPYLLISGGEPFMRKDLGRICSLFYRNCGTRFITIPTNGSLPEQTESVVSSLLETCPRLTLRVRISLDGTRETHDRIRRHKGLFEKAMKTYRKLEILRQQYTNLNIDAITVFSRFNQDNIYELSNHIAGEMNLNNYIFVPIRPGGGEAKAYEYSGTLYERCCERTKLIRTQGNSCFPGVFSLLDELSLRKHNNETAALRCPALRKMAVLGEEGDVFPCEVISTSTGNVRDFNYDMKGTLRSKQSEKIKRAISSSGCDCYWSCNKYIRLVTSPRAYPKLLWKLFSVRRMRE